jgi:hypothetical protein
MKNTIIYNGNKLETNVSGNINSKGGYVLSAFYNGKNYCHRTNGLVGKKGFFLLDSNFKEQNIILEEKLLLSII